MTIDVIIIAGLAVLNMTLIFIVYVMYVRIRQLLNDVTALKSRMEFSDNEIEVLAEAVRGISGIK